MSSSGVAEKREAMAIDEFDPDAEQEIPEELPIVSPKAKKLKGGAVIGGVTVIVATVASEVVEEVAICETFIQVQAAVPDYRDEAQKLFARLNLGPQGAASKKSKATGRYNDLDAVWREPAATAAATAGAVIEINPLRSPPSPRLPVSRVTCRRCCPG